jgi:hypothetical protein
VGVDFPNREIEEPWYSSGRGRRRFCERTCLRACLHQVVLEKEDFFAFCIKEEGNLPCRQGDRIDSHLIQRKEKTRGEGEGKRRIQKWKERYVIYELDSKIWRQCKDAQPMRGILAIQRVKLKLNMGKKLQPMNV